MIILIQTEKDGKMGKIVKEKEKCPTCDGKGKIYDGNCDCCKKVHYHECRTCDGNGYIIIEREIEHDPDWR